MARRFRTVADVFACLGADAEVPRYLRPLNLMWSEEGADSDLAHFEALAVRLESQPEMWAVLLRAGWREALTACVCLILRDRSGFGGSLLDQLLVGSFVGPQLAMTLGLVERDRAVEDLRGLLARGDLGPKEQGGVAAVLERLGDVGVVVPDEGEVALGRMIVEGQWGFWLARVGRGRCATA